MSETKTAAAKPAVEDAPTKPAPALAPVRKQKCFTVSLYGCANRAFAANTPEEAIEKYKAFYGISNSDHKFKTTEADEPTPLPAKRN